MKIRVIQILQNNIVRFVTNYGTAIGIWGDDTSAELDEYYVEIDVCKKISCADMKFVKNDTLKIKEMDGGVLITGILSECDTDGYAVINMEDANIAVEVEYNEEISNFFGWYVTILASEIKIYDEHL